VLKIKPTVFCPDLTRIKINGSDGVPTPWITIAPAGFNEGQAKSMLLHSNEVGKVTSITFEKPKDGPDHILADCKFEYIEVQHPTNENIQRWNMTQEILKTKLVKSVPVTADETSIDEAAIDVPVEEEETGTEKELDVDTAAADLIFNGNACLTEKEKLEVLNLECDTTLESRMSEFGIEDVVNLRANIWPNFNQRLVRCPATCITSDTKTMGLGIHPFTTPICQAAVADRVVSP
jgi:hypothetical protein